MMFRGLVGVVAGVMLALPLRAMACNPGTERCQQVMSLMEVVGYEQKVRALQMECRGRAAAMRPEFLEKERPTMLMGLQRDTGSWKQLEKAYEKYVDEACGGEEVIGLILGGYRIAWDRELDGRDVGELFKKVKSEGVDAVELEMASVTASMNKVVRPLLVAMNGYAEMRYQARVKGVVSGEAVEVAEADMCGDSEGGELTKLSDAVMGKVPKLRARKN